MSRRIVFLGVVWLAAAAVAPVQTVRHGLRVPPGFEVIEYADSKLANDIFCMTIDPRAASSSRAPATSRILVDDEGKGKATRPSTSLDGPTRRAPGPALGGRHALFHRRRRPAPLPHRERQGRSVGADPRAEDRRRTRRPRHPPRSRRLALRPLRQQQRHRRQARDAADVADQGADRRLRRAFLAGPEETRKSSPTASAIRTAWTSTSTANCSPSTRTTSAACRCRGTSRRASITSFPAATTAGWRRSGRSSGGCRPTSSTWSPPLMPLGRGSPTGVVCYRHVQFPRAYRGGFFLVDWTFGRVYFVTLKRSGSSYTCEKQVFLEAVGDNGFAPTAAGGASEDRRSVHLPSAAVARAGPSTGCATRGLSGARPEQGGARWTPYRAAFARLAAGLQEDLVEQAKAMMYRGGCERWSSLAGTAPTSAAASCKTSFATTGPRRPVRPPGRGRSADDSDTAPNAGSWLRPLEDGAASRRLRSCELRCEPTCVIGGRPLAQRQGRLRADRVDCVPPAAAGPGRPDGATRPRAQSGRATRHAAPTSRGTGRTRRAQGPAPAFPSGHADLDREISRTLAILEDDDVARSQDRGQAHRELADPSRTCIT